MSFEPRTYPDIVRDMLTVLTGGTVRESLVFPAGDGPLDLPPLADRPVVRVAHLEGFVARPDGAVAPYRFTPADFELELDADGTSSSGRLVFRPEGRRPAPGTTLTVNYYPVDVPRTPLTDIQVGSVARTLLETVAREVAATHQQLDHVYRSGFLETAEGKALDRVVALVGVRRLPAGTPLVKARIDRQAQSPGRLTIPAGTAAVGADGQRYRLVRDVTLEPGETQRTALFVGNQSSVPVLEANALAGFETVIAGVQGVHNPEAGWRAREPESDADLRRRARSALRSQQTGTVDALKYGVASVEHVQSVEVVEMPNGVPGEVRIDVAYAPGQDAEAAVRRRIERLRPAGIRVLLGAAERLALDARVRVVLAGAGVDDAARDALRREVEDRLTDYFTGASPGAKLTEAKALSQVLRDDRVAEAEIELSGDSGPVAWPVQLEAAQVVELRSLVVAEPEAEAQAPRQVTVSAFVPVHLEAGVTAAQAKAALDQAFISYLGQISWSRPFTVDDLLAQLRDDTRYAIAREDVVVTVTFEDRFMQLVDGQGRFEPTEGDTVRAAAGGVELDVREGL